MPLVMKTGQTQHADQQRQDGPGKLLTASQFGKLVSMSGSSIGRLIRQGVIPEHAYHQTPGGHYRIYKFAIQYLYE